MKAFNIVRAIAMSEVPPERIHYRDGKSYFTVLLDNKQPQADHPTESQRQERQVRHHLRTGKDVGVRRDIASVVDIYKVASNEIRQTIKRYENGGVLSESSAVEGA